MKATLFLLLSVASLGVARAQDAGYVADQPEYAAPAVPIPAVVYEAPVVYAAPVVYQAPVIYNAPVFYAAAMAAAPFGCYGGAAACTPPPVSTVTYIGGGQVHFQASIGSCGSTVTYIGGCRH